MWRRTSTKVIVIIGIDQITKALARKYLCEGQPLNVIGNFMQLTLLYNENGVWGLNFNIPYIPFMIVAIILIIVMLKKTDIKYNLPLTLILAGALGNLIDRIRLKVVVDFFDFGIGNLRWAVFNIADLSISIGIILWLLIGLKETSKSKTQNPEPEATTKITP